MVDLYRTVAVVSEESPLETRRNITLQCKSNSDAPKHVLCIFKSLKYPTKGFNILHHTYVSHSVHPIHFHHPIVSLNIFLILITIIDTHSFTDCLDFGMPFLLLIYIYLSPPSKSNSKNTFGIILYQTLIMKIHVRFIYYVLVTSAIIFLLL